LPSLARRSLAASSAESVERPDFILEFFQPLPFLLISSLGPQDSSYSNPLIIALQYLALLECLGWLGRGFKYSLAFQPPVRSDLLRSHRPNSTVSMRDSSRFDYVSCIHTALVLFCGVFIASFRKSSRVSSHKEKNFSEILLKYLGKYPTRGL
jgi:hypothetical protein